MMGRWLNPASSRDCRVWRVTCSRSGEERYTASPLEPLVTMPAIPAFARRTAWWPMVFKSRSSVAASKKTWVGA